MTITNQKLNYIPVFVVDVNASTTDAKKDGFDADFIITEYFPNHKAPIFFMMYHWLDADPDSCGSNLTDLNNIFKTEFSRNDHYSYFIQDIYKGSIGGGESYYHLLLPQGSFNAVAPLCFIIHFVKDDYYYIVRTLGEGGNPFYYNMANNLANDNSHLKKQPSNDVFGSVETDIQIQFTWDSSPWWGHLKQVDETARKILKLGKRIDPDNPYDGGDDKGDDDNTSGDYDHTSDPVPEPDLPSVSVTDSGLVTLFAPTESQLKSLANYLWSDAFSLDSFKKMLNNPMDCILGLSIVPVNVPRGSAREITVGNIVTTVSCDICPTQYVKVDCGTFTFDRHNMTNSYLDYSPYSKCYLYLPFIGVQEINIDEFMQSTMHVVYHVDILTGAMFCYVMRDSSVMYTYMGQCAENVPLSSSSYSNTIGSIMTAAASIVGVASVAATGGASAPVAAGLLAGATTSTSNAVTSLKPSVAHSGSIGGGAGIMGVNYPYLIFNTPHVSIPSQQRHYTGYPSNQIVKLSALKGFNVIQAINLSVSGANDAEMNEIENMLKGGVIL